MKTFKTLLQPTLAILLSVLMVAGITYATGTLVPQGTAGDDTQYTLSDIYNKLTTGATASIGSGTIVVPGTISATFHTLTEIYDAIPDFATGNTVAASSSAQGTSLVLTVPEGYYSGADSVTVSTSSTNFVAANIADGVTIFGVEGTLEGAAATPTWQTPDPALTLCWDSDQTYDEDSDGNWDEETDYCMPNHGETAAGYGATEYCDHLEADGSTLNAASQGIWRLPTIQEFLAITDYTLYSNATAVTGFTAYGYWSSTPDARPGAAWTWGSYSGYTSNDGIIYQYSVRCAR